jgi:hypothetical protein
MVELKTPELVSSLNVLNKLSHVTGDPHMLNHVSAARREHSFRMPTSSYVNLASSIDGDYC